MWRAVSLHLIKELWINRKLGCCGFVVFVCGINLKPFMETTAGRSWNVILWYTSENEND